MADLKRKQFSQQFSSIEIPPPLDQTNPELLALLIHQKEGAPYKHYRIIDVRLPDEYARGYIKGSENIPLEEIGAGDAFAEKYLEQQKNVKDDRIHLFFVSLQSPDIDEVAALSFVRSYEELVTGGNTNESVDTSFVHVLLGGMFHWLQLFGPDPALTEKFDKEHWAPLLQRRASAPE